MPSASGVYSLPPGYLAVTGATIQASQHNPPLEDIAAALTLRLSRDGSAPMTGALQTVDGTVGAPALAFASSPTTGLYKTTAGFGVSVGGAKVAEFVPGGIIGARFIGELIPWSGHGTAPALTVYPAGQTLSRTTFAALWAFAQTEIAAGGTFYNNGDGSTTFGIGDLRGRVIACADTLFTAAGRLTTAGSGVDGTTFGAVGGSQNAAILQANLPAATLATAVNDPGHSHVEQLPVIGGGSGNTPPSSGTSAVFQTNVSTLAAVTGITASTQLGGSGTAFKLVQPTMVCVYLLFAGV